LSGKGALEYRRLSVAEHAVPRERVNANAIDVTARLQDAGFTALLVGGCVRDLLLGIEPKDFDVATDATPEEVRSVFRRSRLVGRRFRIAHVRYGREIIEVSTFRRAHAEDADERSHSESGRILRDNVYGTLEEDAFRRDFTINALYYNPQTEEVLDFVGGLEDLAKRRIHFIGDTLTRTREDPVRVLRAIRFKAKLDFEIDPAIIECFEEAAQLMADIPPARLFDETLKLLMSGQAEQTWRELAKTPLRATLFPASDPDSELIVLAMRNTDQRIAEDKPVTPGFLIAVLLWQDYVARIGELEADFKPAEARAHAAADCLSEQHQVITIPRRFSQFARDVWGLQGRLEARSPRMVDRLLAHPKFRAGYDFLVLRSDAGEVGEAGQALGEIADWWTSFQAATQTEQRTMIDALRGNQQPGTRKRRRRRSKRTGSRAQVKPAGDQDDPDSDVD